MLLDNPTLQGIVEGRIRVVFRTWRKPTVRAGGTLRTRSGLLAIEAVDAIAVTDITARDVKQAGFRSLQEVERSLDGRVGTLYRIRVRHAGEDPRIALRAQVLDDSARLAMQQRLTRMDAASSDGAWTRQYLELIAARPAQRAPELAELMGLETKPFKQRVRRLKELGLTESLKVGYRLSARGESFLQASTPGPRRARKHAKA
jgi:hypothetical protein